MNYSLGPEQAWDPLPAEEWNPGAVRHLLRRTGWGVVPRQAETALQGGLAAALDQLFPAAPAAFPRPASVARVAAEAPANEAEIKQTADPMQKRRLRREQRERYRSAMLDLTLEWLQFAAAPENAAYQKWVLFLSDIYVVGFEKAPRTPLLYDHFNLISKYGLGSAPTLSKWISRSPAMVIYLDLGQNREGAPNENFARELFELFTLGEGNYTEHDIKEAARAFTGYRLREGGEFFFAPHQHDFTPKTVFGQTGNFTGDDVIDLAYGTRAAGAFVPHELVKFYLSDTMLPKEYLYALGDRWRTEGQYSLRWLARRFFGSRLFFAPEFRGEFIKSPVQFYLGLIQELDLDVLPAPRFVVNPLRQMGQTLYNPPNVRGWVGGRNWINSASLAARRGLVEFLFNPLNEEALNQDEWMAVTAASAQGRDTFTVDDSRFEHLQTASAQAAAEHLATTLLPGNPRADFVATLAAFIGEPVSSTGDRVRRLRRAATALL
jgi:uncharacterized protein (DUF1800 family)